MRTRWRKARGAIRPGRLLAVTTAVTLGLSVPMFLSAPAGAAAYSNDQWGLQVIGASTAWQYGTGAGVKIGIVDTGVDGSQQDLTGKVVAGKTFLSNPSGGCAGASQDPNGADDNGHGTHVAGIAAASGQYGVTGAAPGASLVVAKVLDCAGSGEYQDVVSGIDWVVQQGAKVVNLSLGDASIGGLVDTSNISGSPLGQALQNAWNAGAIPVIAAGNNSDGLFGFGDANYSGVPAVVVAATGSPSNGEQSALASYSNGVNEAEWGVAAPGGDDPNGPTTPTCGEYDQYEILSTYWTSTNSTGCYVTDEGTSMATPFVSGTLADLLGRGLSSTQAVQTLLATANRSVSCGSDCDGLINAGAAMRAAATGATPAVGSPSRASAPPPSTTAPQPGTPSSAPRSGATAAAGATTSTTTPSPTTAAPSTAPRSGSRVAALGSHDAGGGSGGGWWIVLVVVLGVAAVSAAGLVGRRRWAFGHAGKAGAGSEVHGPGVPWSDWPSTN